MGNVNVVTGGGSGIGKAIALMLPKEDTTVITGRNLEKLNKVCEQANADGYHLVATTCDVSKREDVKKLAEYAASLGDVKKVVNCAGVSGSMGNVEYIISINALGTVHMNQEFYKVMNGGVICDIASDSAHLLPKLLMPKGNVFKIALEDEEKFVKALSKKARIFHSEQADVNFAYFMSKNFVQWYARNAAYKYSNTKGIRIFSVSPGFVKTPMTDAEQGEATDIMLGYSGLKRGAEPEEIAFLVTSLMDDRCGYFVGADVLVDGGCVNNGYSMLTATKPYDGHAINEKW